MGFEVATTQFYPPRLAAVVRTFVFSAVYYAATGVYFFSDSHVPIAVFLGMHLLFTDPATSPRTELGRIVYGVLYGLTTCPAVQRAAARGDARVLRQAAAGAAAQPVRGAARQAGAVAAAPANRSAAAVRAGRCSAPASPGLHQRVGGCLRRHERVRVLGDKHPGQWLPFWQKACAADARSACEDLYFLQDGYCEDGSGWACNELGILLAEHYANRVRAAMEFERACGLGFSAGCDNTVRHHAGRHVPPRRADGCRLPVHPAR